MGVDVLVAAEGVMFYEGMTHVLLLTTMGGVQRVH